MSDLIDRQELLREYQKLCKHVACYECQFTDTDGTCKLERFIINAPSAHRWIPVSERLPEMFHDVLISTTLETVDRAYRSFTCWFHTGGMDCTSYENDEILAWMPLPEAWKGEEE